LIAGKLFAFLFSGEKLLMLVSRQPIVASVRRDAWVEIDLLALEKNVAAIKSWFSPNTRLMAVVKSDAYGHGATGVAAVLTASGATWLGVASVDEGCQLRSAGITQPILLLSPVPSWAIGTALESDLQLTVLNASQVSDIVKETNRTNKPANVHVKVDTGMHRLGAPPEQVGGLLESIANEKSLRLAGIFSHLAKSDDAEVTDRQNQEFKRVLDMVAKGEIKPPLVHLASGDAARRFPETHYDMVRVGLYLYGLEARAVSDVVTAAMSVRGRINHLQTIEAGQSVGYNLTWTAERTTRIASIPIGYADGVDRRLSNKLHALLLGQEIRQIGLISMDQMLFDVTDVADADEGDVVTLIGQEHAPKFRARQGGDKQLYLSDWANLLDTITYELACRLRARMPRMYTRSVPPQEG
jgi:alanine racemase